MRSRFNLNNSYSKSRIGLYAFVFASKVSFSLVLILFISFFIQPVHLAYANEIANEIAEAEAQTEIEDVADDVVFEDQTAFEEVVDTASEEAVDDVVAPVDEVDGEDSQATDQSQEDVSPDSSTDTVAPEPEATTSSEDGASSATTTDESFGGGGVENVFDGDNSVVSNQVATSTDEDINTTGTTTVSDVVDDSTSTSTSDAESQSASTTDSVPDIDIELSSTTDSDSNSSTTEDSVSSSGGSTGSSADSDESDSSGSNDEPDSSDESQVVDASSGSGGLSSSDKEEDEVSEEDVVSEESLVDQSTLAPEEAEGVVNNVEYLVTDENYFQFNKQACVSVGEGSYHCSITEGNVVDSKAVVYSEIGDSGSPEIFIRTSGGEVKQITDDNFEDSSPHYDPVSQRIVWQRLIQGRYQIVVYDINTSKEKQLTFSRMNNMEPAVSESGVVWQAWDNNDWEIMFYDGTYTDQITSNSIQDLAPVMEDEYIIWTVIGGESQYAQVYSFETKEVVTINNHEGGSIVNPRFVLVYDTQFDNGDVITQRFDPETGFAEAIAAKPAEAPMEIPEADTAGEVKALIQTKSTSKQTYVTAGDVSSDGSDEGLSGVASSTINLSQSEVNSDDSMVATSSDGVVDVELDSGDDSFLELDEFDLILPSPQLLSATPTVSIDVASSTN